MSGPTIQATKISSLLLDIYADGRDSHIADFMPRALGLLRRYLPFDAAWWGLRGLGEDGHHVHGSHTEGLPSEMPELWRTMCGDAMAVRLLTHQTGRTSRFEPSDIDRSAGAQWLARASGARHVLCTESTDALLAHHAFLCLFRRDERAAFTDGERQLKELVMPHLQAALEMNRSGHLRRLALEAVESGARWAAVDRRGVLHEAEPGFLRAIEDGWPDWCGPVLPVDLLQRFAENGGRWACRELAFEVFWQGDVALLSSRPASLLDRLSPREQSVARAFGAGLSYKAVARRLEMAPATVRHHLRNVYVKLGVDNKAAITRIVHGQAGRIA